MAKRPEKPAVGGRNKPALALHVPEPKFRPGDAVDFSHLEIPQAGLLTRPDETIHPSEIADFAYGLIRVLGDDNREHGAWDPKLDPHTFSAMQIGITSCRERGCQ